MKAKFVFISLTLILGLVSYTKQADNIIELTESNFDEQLKNHELIAVLFTQEGYCPLCVQLGGEFEKAAEILKEQDPSIKLARFITQMSESLTEKHKIKNLPTLQVMRNGVADTPFHSLRHHQKIIQWLKKNAAPSVKALQSSEELEAFLVNNKIVVVAFSEADEEFIQLAKAYEDILFASCSNESCLKNYSQYKGKTVLFQDSGKVAHVKEDLQTVDNLIFEFILPEVTDYTKKTVKKYLGIYYIDNKSSNSFAKNREILAHVAPNYRKLMKAYVIDMESDDGKSTTNLYNFKTSELPLLKIVTTTTPRRKIYDYPAGQELTVEGVDKFIRDFVEDKLIPTPKSEDIPTEQTGSIYKVVRKTFDDIVLNSDKNVLIKYYNNYCGWCKKLQPIYQELAEKLNGTIDNLLIAEIDITNNELDEKIETRNAIPQVVFWLAKDKSKGIFFEGEKNLENLVKFVYENLGIEYKEPVKSEL
jgi:protein disulfide-isomerase A1